MAVTAAKTWIAGEVLSASDLNSGFLQVFNNGEDLGWPATKAKDLNKQDLELDDDRNTTIDGFTNDVITFTLGGVETFKMDGSAGTLFNGLNFIAKGTGVDPSITVISPGSDTNVGLDIVTMGTGVVDITTGLTIDDDEVVSILGQQVFT